MKELPHDTELEQAVLGASMLEVSAFPQVADILTEESFYITSHKHVYKALTELYTHGEPIDILTTVDKLKTLNLLDGAGGVLEVTKLTNRVNQSGNIIYYARLLQQLQIKRQLINITKEIGTKAYNDTSDAFELLNELDSKLFEISSGSTSNQVVSIDKVCDIVQRELFEPSLEDIGKLMPTGFPLLDDYLGGGLKLNRYCLLGGRPGMGKTSFALQLMLNMARLGTPIMFFSRETDKESILKRLICNIASIEEYRMNPVSLEYFQKGVKTRLSSKREVRKQINFTTGEEEEIELKSEVERVTDALSELSTLPIYINDTTGMSVGDSIAITKKMIFQHKIKIVVGDYVQLLNGNKGQSRNDELSETSRMLKALSQNEKVTVLELAQLSRAVETRGGDKRPQLSDLRESGQFEQDGQIIMFNYRPEYYGITEDAEGNSIEGLMEIIVAKNKDGATAAIPFKFTGKYFRIEEFKQTEL